MELDEETPPSITTRANYPSAEAHAEDLTKTFEEERDMGMVEGPYTAQQAARRCGCSESDLRPGPMAAIEELDKIRTIFDGSVCHQNDYIRANTKERTTAPMVHDAFHALHWLKWAANTGAGDHARGWFPPAPDEDIYILKADVTKAHRPS